jgi:hypothetical protein
VAAKKPDDRHSVPTNAEVAELDAAGVDSADVIALLGYVGAPPKEGTVRLHPRLGDLSVSIDIAATDVLLTREAPTETLPLGGVVLWVSRTADVTFRRTRTVASTAQQVRQFFTAGLAGEAADIVPADRLNIRMTHGKVPPAGPVDYCYSPGPCGGTSHCLPPCQSRPA